LPQCFKAATILPLYKGKGSRKAAKNYRPISLLNIYTKIFERFVFYRLYDRVESSLAAEQHGFRKNMSCISALSIFSQYIYSSIDKRSHKAVAIFIDMTKAFDSIDQNLLIMKLMSEFHLKPWYVTTIREIFRNRVFKIGSFMRYFCMPRGVCQGSALGPLLFSLYINTIGKSLTCPFLLYADDLVIYDSGTDAKIVLNRLKAELDKVGGWCRENGLRMNFDKTKYMIFHKEKDRTLQSSENFRVKCEGQLIERVFEFKYLGFIFDPHMNFCLHYDSVLKKVVSRLKYLRGIKRFLSFRVMKIMLNSYVHSVTDYAIEIWAVQCQSQLNEIQKRIDRFLLEFHYPKPFRYKRRSGLTTNRFSSNDMLTKCNFLTVAERYEFVLLKSAFKSIVKGNTVTINSRDRSFPKLTVLSCNSESLRRSIVHRTAKFWNSLPRHWCIKEMSYDNFKESVIS
jgi:hypothetical protein